MKRKIMSLAMAAVMAVGMTVSAIAAETKITAEELFKNKYGNLNPQAAVERADKETGSQITLGPDGTDNAGKAGVQAIYTADTAGRYTIKIAYIGKTSSGAVRKFSYQIDDGEKTDVKCETGDTWDTLKDVKVITLENVQLTKGQHTVKLSSTTDWDNTNVKTPNACYVSFELTQADAAAPSDNQPTTAAQAQQPTTAAQAQQQATTAAAATQKPAATGDTAAPIVFVALAAIAVAGVSVAFRKKTA